MAPSLKSLNVLGLQLPEVLASTGRGEGFWEFESMNIWGPKVEKVKVKVPLDI